MRYVFVSYRRDDSGDFVDRLAPRLRAAFGEGAVFVDVGGVPVAADWPDHLEQTLRGASALLCIMGPNWLGADGGRRRVDDPDDWVRREVRGALEHGVPILPVLAGSSGPPAAADVPPDLQPMLRIQAVRSNENGLGAILEWLTDHLIPPIQFADLLELDTESMASVADAFRQRVAEDSFFCGTPTGERAVARAASDQRAVAVRQPVRWHRDLLTALEGPQVRDSVRADAFRLLRSVERRISHMWIGLLRYAGPPTSLGTTAYATQHLCGFAALKVLYQVGVGRIAPHLHCGPRWEWDIDQWFRVKGDIGSVDVTRVSGLDRLPEPVLSMYGSVHDVRDAYGKSLGRLQLMTGPAAAWYSEFFVPQLELILAAHGSDHTVFYDGELAIRKAMDLRGDDLSPFDSAGQL